jgi:hypothetical protein
LLGCFISFFLFGYLVGFFFVIVGTSYYYGYKKLWPIVISVVSMFIMTYVVLYKLLEAPEDFGVLLTPILRALRLI